MKMQRQGRLSFSLECRGEEAVGIAAGMVFRPEDLLFPSYRMQGIFLVRGMPMVKMMCHCIGNRGDSSKGRQMPVHYSWKQGNLVSISVRSAPNSHRRLARPWPWPIAMRNG